MSGDLYVRLLWFHDYAIRSAGTDADIDNILKPVMDAVIGIAYVDDRQVVRCVSSRHRMTASNLAGLAVLPTWVQNRVDGLLTRELADFLFVSVGPTIAT